jgi:hypothetical protein
MFVSFDPKRCSAHVLRALAAPTKEHTTAHALYVELGIPRTSWPDVARALEACGVLRRADAPKDAPPKRDLERYARLVYAALASCPEGKTAQELRRECKMSGTTWRLVREWFGGELASVVRDGAVAWAVQS